jgi:uncharacterized protein YhbP (UPF0306 family)
MQEELAKRAKEIIEKIIYITLASVTPKGKPWNSPLYSAYDKDTYAFYWVSPRATQHSNNIAENQNVFLTIYDSTVPEGTGEGVYIQRASIRGYRRKRDGKSYLSPLHEEKQDT